MCLLLWEHMIILMGAFTYLWKDINVFTYKHTVFICRHTLHFYLFPFEYMSPWKHVHMFLSKNMLEGSTFYTCIDVILSEISKKVPVYRQAPQSAIQAPCQF